MVTCTCFQLAVKFYWSSRLFKTSTHLHLTTQLTPNTALWSSRTCSSISTNCETASWKLKSWGDTSSSYRRHDHAFTWQHWKWQLWHSDLLLVLRFVRTAASGRLSEENSRPPAPAPPDGWRVLCDGCLSSLRGSKWAPSPWEHMKYPSLVHYHECELLIHQAWEWWRLGPFDLTENQLLVACIVQAWCWWKWSACWERDLVHMWGETTLGYNNSR